MRTPLGRLQITGRRRAMSASQTRTAWLRLIVKLSSSI